MLNSSCNIGSTQTFLFTPNNPQLYVPDFQILWPMMHVIAAQLNNHSNDEFFSQPFLKCR